MAIPALLAPLLSGGLTLLSNAVLTKGKEVVEKKLGISLKENPSAEDMLAYKQAELEHEEFLISARLEENKLGLELEKEFLKDKQDAREMQQTALKTDDPFARRFIYWFSWFWALFGCAYIAAITFLEVPKENIRVVDTSLGFILGTLISSVLSFFYGSAHKIEKSMPHGGAQ